MARSTALLRCYPRAWRERYGDEFVAMLDDLYGDRRFPARVWCSLAWHGLAERVRAAGLHDDRSPAAQRQAGALLVLCAWGFVVLAGGSFAKYSEHWGSFVPRRPHAQLLARVGADVVIVSALVGLVLVVVAASATLPAFVSAMRGGQWSEVRAPFRRAALSASALVAVSAGITVWARRIGPAHHAPSGARLIVVAWAALIAVTVCLAVAAAVAAVRVAAPNRRVLRIAGWCAGGVAGAAIGVAAGVAAWTVAMAPSLHALPDAGNAGLRDPQLLATFVLLTAGVALAAVGAGRVFSSRDDHAASA